MSLFSRPHRRRISVVCFCVPRCMSFVGHVRCFSAGFIWIRCCISPFCWLAPRQVTFQTRFLELSCSLFVLIFAVWEEEGKKRTRKRVGGAWKQNVCEGRKSWIFNERREKVKIMKYRPQNPGAEPSILSLWRVAAPAWLSASVGKSTIWNVTVTISGHIYRFLFGPRDVTLEECARRTVNNNKVWRSFAKTCIPRVYPWFHSVYVRNTVNFFSGMNNWQLFWSLAVYE